MSVYKISVVGTGGTGKSSLIIRYTQNVFVEEYNPTIEDVHKKRLYGGPNQNPILLDIIDTAGQEEFSGISEYYLKDSDGFVIVYSINSVNSFLATEKFFKDIKRLKNGIDFPTILVGNKIDLVDRSITTQQGEEHADIHNCLFIESSAMSGKKVNDIFEILVKEMNKHRTTVLPKSKSRSGISKGECIII